MFAILTLPSPLLRQPQTSHGALALAIACALVSSCLGLGRLDLAGNGRPCTGAMRLKGGCGFLSVYGSTMDHHSLRMKILQVPACRVHQTATAQSAHAASLPAPTCVRAASCLAHCTVSFEAVLVPSATGPVAPGRPPAAGHVCRVCATAVCATRSMAVAGCARWPLSKVGHAAVLAAKRGVAADVYGSTCSRWRGRGSERAATDDPGSRVGSAARVSWSWERWGKVMAGAGAGVRGRLGGWCR